MEQIKETIKNVIGRLERQKEGVFSDGPEEILKKVLAKKALKHVKLYNFRKGVLSIKVDSSSWLYLLSLQKEDLLVKLRKLCAAVKDVRFYLGD